MASPAQAAAQRPTRVRWLIFALACAVSWMLYLHRYSWGVIKPAFRAENPELTATELGWLDAAFNAAYALAQVPAGAAGDMLGPRGVLAGSIFLWSIAAAAVVWTGSTVRILVFRATFGLAQAGTYPIIAKMTRNWFPLGIRTSVQGIVTAFGRIGAACSSIVLATLLMGVMGFGWREALVILACPGLALAVVFWIVARNSPAEHPWANRAEQELIDGPAAPASGKAKDIILLTRSTALSFGMMLLYAFASTFQDQLYVYWIPLFLVEGRGMDATTMGLFTPLPLLGGAAGGILGGILNDVLIRKWGNRRWARSTIAITGKMIAAFLVVLAVTMQDGRLAMVVLLAARVFGDWSLPTQWGALTDISGRAAATIFGIVNAVGAAGGFVAGPVLGWLRQHHGWEGLFLGVAIMCMVAALTWVFIDCTKKLVAD